MVCSTDLLVLGYPGVVIVRQTWNVREMMNNYLLFMFMIHFKLHSLINSVVFVIGLSDKDNSEPFDWSKLGKSVTLTTECVTHLIEQKYELSQFSFSYRVSDITWFTSILQYIFNMWVIDFRFYILNCRM